MEKQIIKIVRRWFNELVGGYHLPYFAQVVAVAQDRAAAEKSDEYNPVYSVDVQILDAKNKPDLSFPVLTSLAVPLPGAGDHRGFIGLPKVGAMVEVAFARGLPSQPFIRSVLAHGVVVPGVEGDEVRWQQSAGVYQRADKDGGWHRVTTQGIADTADSITQRINTIYDSLADEKQIIKTKNGGKVWLGSEQHNVLKLLSDLSAAVSQLANIASIHTHPSAPNGPPTAPTQSASFVAQKSSVDAMKGILDPIVE